jgi:hypothetical protein
MPTFSPGLTRTSITRTSAFSSMTRCVSGDTLTTSCAKGIPVAPNRSKIVNRIEIGMWCGLFMDPLVIGPGSHSRPGRNVSEIPPGTLLSGRAFVKARAVPRVCSEMAIIDFERLGSWQANTLSHILVLSMFYWSLQLHRRAHPLLGIFRCRLRLRIRAAGLPPAVPGRQTH